MTPELFAEAVQGALDDPDFARYIHVEHIETMPTVERTDLRGNMIIVKLDNGQMLTVQVWRAPDPSLL